MWRLAIECWYYIIYIHIFDLHIWIMFHYAVLMWDWLTWQSLPVGDFHSLWQGVHSQSESEKGLEGKEESKFVSNFKFCVWAVVSKRAKDLTFDFLVQCNWLSFEKQNRSKPGLTFRICPFTSSCWWKICIFYLSSSGGNTLRADINGSLVNIDHITR